MSYGTIVRGTVEILENKEVYPLINILKTVYVVSPSDIPDCSGYINKYLFLLALGLQKVNRANKLRYNIYIKGSVLPTMM